MKSTKTSPKKDRQSLNYIVLSSMIARAMQELKGTRQIDFDYASDIAWKVSHQISRDVVIERAQGLTVDEILSSDTVQRAQLSRDHLTIPRAQKRPKQRGHNGAMKGVVFGSIGIVIILILAYFAAF